MNKKRLTQIGILIGLVLLGIAFALWIPVVRDVLALVGLIALIVGFYRVYRIATPEDPWERRGV
jgi:hypothetical protein